MEKITRPLIDWGVASRAYAAGEYSGDAYVVEPVENKILVAAIDGLGHGKEAAEAARIAALTLTSHALDDPVTLIRLCHEALLRTRGVALSLASFDLRENTLTWLAVGNVEGILMHADPDAKPSRETLLLRGGVVGYQMPSLRPSTLQLERNDTLIFTTDGIRSGFLKDINSKDAPSRIAEAIITNFYRKTDDALVLVVRYTGDKS